MGTSTDGLLFFGFEIGGDESSVDSDTTAYLRKWDVSGGAEEDEDEDEGDLEEAIYELAQKKEWAGITTVNSCSSNCSLLFLTHDKVSLSASRGYPVELPPDVFEVPSEVLDQMQRFCKEFQVPWQEPKWRLGSYWS